MESRPDDDEYSHSICDSRRAPIATRGRLRRGGQAAFSAIFPYCLSVFDEAVLF